MIIEIFHHVNNMPLGLAIGAILSRLNGRCPVYVMWAIIGSAIFFSVTPPL